MNGAAIAAACAFDRKGTATKRPRIASAKPLGKKSTPSADPPRTPRARAAQTGYRIGELRHVTREPFVAQWATSLLAMLGRAEVQVELGADDRTHHKQRDSHEMHQ